MKKHLLQRQWTAIEQALRVLTEPGQLVEARIINVDGRKGRLIAATLIILASWRARSHSITDAPRAFTSRSIRSIPRCWPEPPTASSPGRP